MAIPAAPASSRDVFNCPVLYGGMVCIAGVLGAKQVSLGPLAVEAGIFPFLLARPVGFLSRGTDGPNGAERKALFAGGESG